MQNEAFIFFEKLIHLRKLNYYSFQHILPEICLFNQLFKNERKWFRLFFFLDNLLYCCCPFLISYFHELHLIKLIHLFYGGFFIEENCSLLLSLIMGLQLIELFNLLHQFIKIFLVHLSDHLDLIKIIFNIDNFK